MRPFRLAAVLVFSLTVVVSVSVLMAVAEVDHL